MIGGGRRQKIITIFDEINFSRPGLGSIVW